MGLTIESKGKEFEIGKNMSLRSSSWDRLLECEIESLCFKEPIQGSERILAERDICKKVWVCEVTVSVCAACVCVTTQVSARIWTDRFCYRKTLSKA